MAKLRKEEISTQVLVIGGGAAGLLAAIEARDCGLDVTLVSKSKVGRSGNTIVAGTGMAVWSPLSQMKDSIDLFRTDTYTSGKAINDPHIVEKFISGSSRLVEKLSACGVQFKKHEEHLVWKHAPGHSVARTLTADFSRYPYLTRGLSLTLPMLETAKRAGVRIVDFTAIIRLLSADGRIFGACGIDKKSKTVVTFKAGCVILSAGGGGWVYGRSNNTQDMTGDSFRLAYEAGATLRDMEFVQFYPSMMFSPVKVTVSSPLFGEGAVLRNALGQRFMQNYDDKADMATRDVMSRAIYSEIKAGRGNDGCVFMDCCHIDPHVLEKRYGELMRLLKKAGLDLAKNPAPISPAAHFFMGGVAINENCETDLPGLLACGESVGGLHGANRLGGNALTETIVFGMIAGNQAKAHVTEGKTLPNLPAVEIEPFRKGDITVSELKKHVGRFTWENLSIIRSDATCHKALAEIASVSGELNHVRIASVSDIVSFYELKSMVSTAELIARGALVRKESRGAHFRSDFPDTENEAFKGSLFYRKREDNPFIQYHSL